MIHCIQNSFSKTSTFYYKKKNKLPFFNCLFFKSTIVTSCFSKKKPFQSLLASRHMRKQRSCFFCSSPFVAKREEQQRSRQTEAQFLKSIVKAVPQWIQKSSFRTSEMVFVVAPKHIVCILSFLKNTINTQFKVLVDITAIDYPSRTQRFELAYNLLSIQHNTRIRIKVCLDELTSVSSITSLYASAAWLEREVWDMFGIFFFFHPDLRRILTDYGFRGYPLRKDFPLSGYIEVRYDDSEKRVISEPLELTQEFRYFDFASPWEQIAKK